MGEFPSALVVGHTTLTRDPTRLLLSFVLQSANAGRPRRAASNEEIERALDRLRLQVEDAPWAPPAPGRRINHTQWGLWVRDTQAGPIDDARLELARQTLASMCRWIGPVYVDQRSGGDAHRICPLPPVLLVGLRAGLGKADIDDAIRTLADLGLHERPERSTDLGAIYVELKAPMHASVYALRDQVRAKLGPLVRFVDFEQMPFRSPFAYEPGDEHYPLQWNMPVIRAPQAWDLTRGDPAVIIAVVDSGCELGHPDLNVLPGFDVSDPTRDGSPVLDALGAPNAHGTNVAGIAAAIIDNTPRAIGVAGVAGRCRILPMAVDGSTDAQVAAGVNRAVRTEGVRVINISMIGWYFGLLRGVLDEAIRAASEAGVLICAAAGNGDARGIISPARHPLVMACGGSDRRDERWSVVLPSGTIRGSHYGDEMLAGAWKGVSVVAPAWNLFPDAGMPTTDLTGPDGVVALPSPAGDYWTIGGFTQTSCATPHVSGVAALLFSLHAGIRGDAVQRIIERTADKVGSVPYAAVDGFPHGTRNEEMGYGRLNAYHAVDFADVMIRDWSGDEGIEPSYAPDGRFWVAPDIVVRPDDDGLFVPADVDLSSVVVAGQPNYVYVRVANNGPQPARAVRVAVRIAIPALAFRYPEDWRHEDDTHVRPDAMRADLGTMAAGTDDRATFVISAVQADRLAEWSMRGQHPCLLAEVTADNDYAFRGERERSDTLVTRRNNLAQRNLAVVGRTSSALVSTYVVDAGHEDDESPTVTLHVDAGRLAREGRVEVCVDEASPGNRAEGADNPAWGGQNCQGRIRLLDPARVEADWCGCRAVVALTPGSEVSIGGRSKPEILKASGAERLGGACVHLIEREAVLVVARQPRTRVRVTLRCTAPAAATDRRYAVHLAQRAANRLPIGGVTLIIGERRDD